VSYRQRERQLHDLRFGEFGASGKKRNSGDESSVIVVLLTGDGRLDDNMNVLSNEFFGINFKDVKDVI